MNKILLSTILSCTVWGITAQNNRDLQYFRPPGQGGINLFETPKDSGDVAFTGVKVRVGGDFTLQFQAIDHRNEGSDTLANLGSNFNLPTANFNLDVQLARGLRMNLVTYLSSRHHPEAWVKGGYIQFDRLDFIREGFLNNVMNVLTVKTGLDEINYGDVHFRRSDNARTIYNPFVGNYIMDAFTTEVFGEFIFQKNAALLVAGMSNGKINQSPVKGEKDYLPSLYAKAGFDKKFNNEFRFRVTGSTYISPGYDNGNYLYSGDRSGARYYGVMQLKDASDNFRSGRFSPGFTRFQSFQINPFLKWKGLEFFGVYELVNGDQNEDLTGGNYTQVGAELLYRIGEKERFYFGGRYNLVTGYDHVDAAMKNIYRFNIAAGYFLTSNVMMKLEYVDQSYTGKGWEGSVYEKGNFNGVMLEAAVSF